MHLLVIYSLEVFPCWSSIFLFLVIIVLISHNVNPIHAATPTQASPHLKNSILQDGWRNLYISLIFICLLSKMTFKPPIPLCSTFTAAAGQAATAATTHGPSSGASFFKTILSAPWTTVSCLRRVLKDSWKM